ncbi:adenosylmethionine decarboxylase [Pseudodesulfovibrio indicus]|uniref:adenosylmethionine decarboxylase n=1 Tax=Pseudodesulfovibrio indicus TaxID=1716143 RepID=UPI00292FB576|nr:adenosylmethionine decarboxylase [Pseudodesulfovibrio indicus]
MNTVGVHCILELKGCPSHLLDDEQLILETMVNAAATAMSTLLDITSHKFQPQGVTALALLAESHISIHTWPESGYAALDIFTCGETARPRVACEYFIEKLQAADHTLSVLPRGNGCGCHMPMAPSEEANLWQARS